MLLWGWLCALLRRLETLQWRPLPAGITDHVRTEPTDIEAGASAHFCDATVGLM